MFKYQAIKHIALLLAGLFAIGLGGTAAAATAEVESNKALVERFLKVKGTPEYRSVAKEVLAADHERTRREFENLKYNADDPKLHKESDPDYVAITDRVNVVTRILGEDNLVAATYRMTGTHSGNLYGIPATDKSIELDGAAIFELRDGKIVESWYMVEEAALLRQLGARLPERVDGKINLPPATGNTRTYDEALAEHLADPKDTPEWRHTKLLLAYKSKPENRPSDYKFEGRPYSTLQRGGIDVIKFRGEELGVEGGHGQSMSGRRDMVSEVVSDGDLAMMRFRLTAVNDGPLYGIPPGGKPLNDWEVGFARFEGDTWVDAWWLKDELGFLLSIGNREALDFLVGPD